MRVILRRRARGVFFCFRRDKGVLLVMPRSSGGEVCVAREIELLGLTGGRGVQGTWRDWVMERGCQRGIESV
jgi:hypothetical protein